jgi:hypothetical protein
MTSYDFDSEPDYDDCLAMVFGFDQASDVRQAPPAPTETNLQKRNRLKANGRRGRRTACDVHGVDDARLASLRSMAWTADRETTVKGKLIMLKPGQIAKSYSYLADHWKVTEKEARGTINRLLKQCRIGVSEQSYGHNVNVYDVHGTAWMKTWSNRQSTLQNRTVDIAQKDRASARQGVIDIVEKNRAGYPPTHSPTCPIKRSDFNALKLKGRNSKNGGDVSVEPMALPPVVAATSNIDQDGIRPNPVAAFAARASGSVSTPAQPLDVVASVSADAGRKPGLGGNDLFGFGRPAEQPTLIEAEIVPDGERFASRSKVAGHDGNCLDGELLLPQRACGPIPDPRDDNHARELLWGPVRAYLASQPGATDASVRSQLGKLRKSGDDLAIVRAAVTAQRTNVIDPLAYMRGVLKAKPSSRNGRSTASARDIFENLDQTAEEQSPWVN